ncbi:MAG TPA: cytochrome c oxidase assembly protein [Casimicrobiaceae bacterium]|nr:cytochrome c oxidase assembly protein [Casimicrobiaceae bacterium]
MQFFVATGFAGGVILALAEAANSGLDADPWVTLALALAALWYGLGLRRLGEAKARRAFGVARSCAFVAGIGAMVVALLSPLDAWAERSFAAHMVQHLLLMLIAPPLLVFGRPALAWLSAFPPPVRKRVGRAWSALHAGAAFRLLTGPLAVYAMASATLWFWHLPLPYDAALGNEAIHVVEHLCLFATALAFWSLVLEPYGSRRMSYGATLLFVATFGVQNGLLGALLTFAARPFYQAYANAEGFASALLDQQLAGLIMWIPASIVHLTTVSALLIAWLANAERRAQAASLAWSAPALRCLLVVPLLVAVVTGCDAVSQTPTWEVDNGRADQGRDLIHGFGCGACHRIPGIEGARGNVGPSLDGFADRVYIAGVLRNEPENLISWLRNPQRVVPGNAMPNLHLSDQDARDIAAYLYKLR